MQKRFVLCLRWFDLILQNGNEKRASDDASSVFGSAW